MVALCLPWSKLEAQGSWEVPYLRIDGTQDTLVAIGNNKDGVTLWFTGHTFASKEDQGIKSDVEGTKTFAWVDPSSYHMKDLYLNASNDEDYSHTVTGKAYHFYASIGLYNLHYAGYSLTNNEWGYKTSGFDYTLAPHATITATEPTIDPSQKAYTQKLKWDIENLNDTAISGVTIMASYDGGESWTPIHTGTKARDSITTTLPWTMEKVRYYAVATKKEQFSMLFDGDTGLTSEPTPDFTPQPVDIPCTLTVIPVSGAFKDAEAYRDRTNTTLVAWKVQSDAAFKSAYLQYSTSKNCDEWHTLLQSKNAAGRQNVILPVGYTHYTFRLVVKTTEDTPLLHDSTIIIQPRAGTYEPVFKTCTINSTLDESYNAETDSITPTIQYVMNDNLYQMRNSPAQISYSVDGGQTWTLATTIDSPQLSGEVQLQLPSTANEYLFRIGMYAMVDNVPDVDINLTSTAYTFTKVIHLNDTKGYKPVSAKSAKVIVNRAYTAGKLGTLCLPFELSADQMAEGFGSGVRVYAFQSVTGSTMDFKQVQGIMGGVPYIVRTAADIDSLVFTGVYIDTTAISQTFPLTYQNEQGQSYTLAGTFSPYTMKTDGTELYITVDGKAKRPSDTGNRMKGYRAYIVLPSASSDIKVNIDGDVTSIEDIHPTLSPQHVNVYNTNGQLVSHTTDHLPKGIYIVNGKKLVIP